MMYGDAIGLRYRSALGVFDGNVYEQLWAKAQTEPLNATEVTEGYEVCPAIASTFS